MGGSFLSSIAIYCQPRLIAIFFLGVSSGLPLLLTASTLSVWLTEEGVNRAAIGAFGLVALPYTLKWLWSPLVDRLPIPVLTRLLGRRRGWMVFTQIGLVISLLALGTAKPVEHPIMVVLLALMVTFCSASQDIVIDAFRVEILDEKTYGAGAAMVVFGYRIGMLIAGAGALYLATFFGWFVAYACMAALVGIGLVTVLLCREPVARPPHPALSHKGRGFKEQLREAVVEPFRDFMSRPNWVWVLVFILLFKLGDAFVTRMSNPFYLAMGFSKIEIANISKVFGVIATILGGFTGGVLVNRFGIMRALLVCGLIQMFSNLVFAVQAMVGHDTSMLMVTIAVENIAGGMATAAFVAYLSSLCHISYTATQYALLSSVAKSGDTILASASGLMAQSMSWEMYFVGTSLLAAPAMIVLLWLIRKGGAIRNASTSSES